jgi:hypothetical protein
MTKMTQPGITPPVPGQDKEEPELWQEDDIPVDNDDVAAHHSGTEERAE